MRTPLVSILTPSYNQAQWLGDNLLSVANQTYPNIEHIVMDGGSTDGSVEILREQAGPHVRWWSEPDRGQSHALNKAFSESHGEIIGWINSDDGYVDRRAVEAAVRSFETRPNLDVTYGHSLLVNGSNEVLQLLWAPPFVRSLTTFVTPYYQPAVFFRRASLPDPLFDESLGYVMDFDLWRRLWETATFDRLNLVVGLERHQRDRKVLSNGYLRERTHYDEKRGQSRTSRRARIVQRACAATFRLIGAPALLMAPSRVQPTIPLTWSSIRRRMGFQLVTRRASMPTAGM
jgi:glycosyltransferase involved in cell wall biosynthesis